MQLTLTSPGKPGWQVTADVIEEVPHPFVAERSLVLEAVCEALADEPEVFGLHASGVRWRGYEVLWSGGAYVILRHSAMGQGEGGKPLVYRNTELLGFGIAERHRVQGDGMVPTLSWGGTIGPLRIVPIGHLGAGMTSIEHGGYANPMALAQSQGGDVVQRGLRAAALARDILSVLGYRAREG